MSETNKALIHRYGEELWNQGHLAVADELIAPAIHVHTSDLPEINGRAAFKEMVTQARTTFPDGTFSPETMIAEGDLVAVHWRFEGTQAGEFNGLAPTHKRISWPMTVFYRFTDGQIAEIWGDSDMLGLLQQLGALPSPE